MITFTSLRNIVYMSEKIMGVKNKSLLPSNKIVIVRLSDGLVVPAKICV